MTNQPDLPVILFVDDDISITTGLLRVLHREPFQCHAANSAAAALEILEQRAVDVLVSDEVMPMISGCELLATVRERFPWTIRIILTGQSSVEAAIHAINEGEVYRFLSKPCNPVELAATIKQALQQKQLQDLSRELLHQHRSCERLLEAVEARSPGIMRLATDSDGAIIADEPDEQTTIEDLLREMARTVASSNIPQR